MIPHHDPDTLRQAAIDGARLAGCNCELDADVLEADDGVFWVRTDHEPRCTLLRRLMATWN